MKNPWRLCSLNPPPQYVRLEIKVKDKKDTYIGYRYGNKYYESIGNYIIENPYKWRFIPQGSYLWEEIRKRIFLISNGAIVENSFSVTDDHT